MTRVLVVDHLPYARELAALLALEARLNVATCGVETDQVLQSIKSESPDVLAVGLHAPQQALEIVTRVMQNCPRPIVVVSAADGSEAGTGFLAMEAGALAVAEWPQPLLHPRHVPTAAALSQTLRTMSEVRVVRRWAGARAPVAIQLARGAVKPRLVLIGGSTGAPAVLREILTQLGPQFPLPLLLVQHMAVGFLPAFCQWLQNASGFPVTIPADGEELRPGRAYLAPDHLQAGVTRDLVVRLSSAPSEHGMCPSVSHLFRSVPADLRPATAAVLLTGMGRDGGAELRELKDGGALTLVQDRSSSVVYGMPGEALKRDAAMLVLAPVDIGHALRRFAQGELLPFTLQ